MGNMHIRGSYPKKKEDDRCASDFYSRLLDARPGQLLHVCSFGKWNRNRRKVCGFTDKTDFSTLREVQKRTGILVKPDTTDGRYFTVGWKSKSEMVVVEKTAWWVGTVRLPRVHVPDMEDPWFRQSQHNRSQRECSLIAYKDGLAVVQVNCNRHFSTAKFYLLDLNQKACIGHFIITYRTRRWYECYISPNKKRILLRPDHLTRIVVLPDVYSIDNMTYINQDGELPEVESIPPALRTHVLTFNCKLGDDFMILGTEQDIEIRSLTDWSIVRRIPDLDLAASIQQIRSSPQGNFVAIRCVYPIHSREFSVNFVAILNFPKLDVVMRLDVCGCYWPVSEIINLQVFPRFSPSECCVAVMRNCSYKRKVFVYKLPPVFHTLQQLCRRAILQLVPLKETEKLPLPNRIVDFLMAGEKRFDASIVNP